MCLILLAWRVREDLPLIVAANRDEFHARPTLAANFWEDHPAVLAGRDLEARGTWMGISRSRRFAAVTNYRGAREPSAEESRGALPVRFLTGGQTPQSYIESVTPRAEAYSGFNLLAADADTLWWMTNRDGAPRALQPGIYGLGNTLLDAPEVDDAKARFKAALDPAPSVEVLFAVLAQSQIVNAQYGTRCSTVLLRRKDQSRYSERSFLPDGSQQETAHFQF